MEYWIQHWIKPALMLLTVALILGLAMWAFGGGAHGGPGDSQCLDGTCQQP